MIPRPPPFRPIRPEASRWRRLLAAALLGLLPAGARALDPAAWGFRQPFTVGAAGLTKLALPAATLDRARPDLADLRLVDAAGREVPYALFSPAASPPAAVPPRRFRAELTDAATVLTLETGTDRPLAAVTLVSPGTDFIKPVRAELSADGVRWEPVADAVPLFRQNRAEQLTVPLPGRPAAWVRLTVDDGRSPPVPFTGATLLAPGEPPPPAEVVPVRIAARDELPGQTVLTLELGAAHLPLTALHFATDDPLFTRSLAVTVRELQGETVVERPLVRGTIFRLALEGLAPAVRLSLPLNLTAPGRELVVHIDNGDSPPLSLTGVRAERRPVFLVFNVTAPGGHTLLVGQPQLGAPRYDLPVRAAEYGRLPVSAVALDPPEANPDYHPPEALADVALGGAPLEPQGWAWRKPTLLAAPGVQQLELDLDVLARAQPGFADLRLLLAGRQVPYLLERTSLARPLPLAASPADDPKQPRLSRWQLRLPQAGLPLTGLTLTSTTVLFQRHLRLFETVADERGASHDQLLADAEWTHAPGRPAAPLTLSLAAPPRTDTLWLETDNGDNPPLVLTGVQAWSPVVRLLFKAAPDRAPTLYYGQPQAGAPSYDLTLVAGQLFSADKTPARLGPAEALGAATWATTFVSRRSGLLFWGALALVVVLLLVIVVRLVPKPPAA